MEMGWVGGDGDEEAVRFLRRHDARRSTLR